MTTSERSQLTLWDGPSNCSQADSPANLSVSPGSNLARQTTVTSGRKWLGLLTNAGPVGCLVRTLLESSDWHSTIALLTWKASVTKRGRLLFRLAVSVPGTNDNGYGLLQTPRAIYGDHPGMKSETHLTGQVIAVRHLLPTPRAQEDNRSPEAYERMLKGRPSPRTAISSLSVAIKMLPTPNVAGGGNRCELTPHRGHFLRPSGHKAHLGLDQVVRMLPTLSVAGLHNRAGESPTSRDGLSTAVKRLPPTPTNSDTCHRTTKYAQGGTPLSMAIGGSLNPDFVEFLMGFPPGWTDVPRD